MNIHLATYLAELKLKNKLKQSNVRLTLLKTPAAAFFTMRSLNSVKFLGYSSNVVDIYQDKEISKP